MKLLKNNFKRFLSVMAAFVMILVAMPAMEAKADLVSPEVNGNEVTFNYYSDSASEVYLAGDMNGWSTTANPMTKEGNVFTITMTLDKGTYAYKFVEEGSNWVADPSNPNTKDDGFGGSNSVVEVTAGEAPKVAESPVVNGNEVTFNYLSATAEKVFLAGTMNEWSTEATPMTKDGDTFSVTLTLEAGTHEYKFVVDGGWINDPGNAEKAENGNNVVTVAGGTTGGDATGDDTTGDDATNEDPANKTSCKYTIYGYSADAERNTITAASIWMWDKAGAGNGSDIAFTETEEIDGKTWLKVVVDFPVTEEVGLILKSAGDGNWAWQTSDLIYANAENADATLYLVDGHSEVYTSIDDISFEAPAPETEEKTDDKTDDKDDKKDTTTSGKKEPMDPAVVAWIVVAVVVVAAAVVAVIVVKKLTSNLPVEEKEDAEEATENEE